MHVPGRGEASHRAARAGARVVYNIIIQRAASGKLMYAARFHVCVCTSLALLSTRAAVYAYDKLTAARRAVDGIS